MRIYCQHILKVLKDNFKFVMNNYLSLINSIPICWRKLYFQVNRLIGCNRTETLTSTRKTLNKIRLAQRTIELMMLSLSLKDRILNTVVTVRSEVTDAITNMTSLKWKWIIDLAKANKWLSTRMVTEWEPRDYVIPSRDRLDEGSTLYKIFYVQQ